MKKSILFLFVFLLLGNFSLFAQVAKIVATEGDVQVRLKALLDWQAAKPNMYLEMQSEIKTSYSSECTIAFDEELSNVLTIKENSRVLIEKLKPGKVFLPRGRVFSLVDDLAKVKEFEIRTPTAITGVRGTGDSVESGDDGTKVKCFEGKVNVGGLDEQGNPTEDEDLSGGQGLEVGDDGELGDPFDLSSEDFEEWFGFKDDLGSMRNRDQDPDPDLGDSGNDLGDSFDELRDEQLDDFKDQDFEEMRSGEDEYCPDDDDDYYLKGDDDDDEGGYGEY